jgi:hypothetical protein
MWSRLAVATVTACIASAAGAQTDFQWKQTTSILKGQNMPAGIKADVLGIELGTNFTDAKATLEKLAAEGEPPREPVQLRNMTVTLSSGAGAPVEGKYVGQAILNRTLPSQRSQKPDDTITLDFSAPSSGQQVIRIARTLVYNDPADQPKMADIVAALDKKFGTAAQVNDLGPETDRHQYAFANGAAISFLQVPEGQRLNFCPVSGRCAVEVRVDLRRGISPDRVSKMEVVISDNARETANKKSDESFFENYFRELSKGSSAAPPKL